MNIELTSVRAISVPRIQQYMYAKLSGASLGGDWIESLLEVSYRVFCEFFFFFCVFLCFRGVVVLTCHALVLCVSVVLEKIF